MNDEETICIDTYVIRTQKTCDMNTVEVSNVTPSLVDKKLIEVKDVE